VIHLASCYLASYPICPYLKDQRDYIEKVVGLPVRIGTHPMPRSYLKTHEIIGDWRKDRAEQWLSDITQDSEDADKYDSRNPNFLKK